MSVPYEAIRRLYKSQEIKFSFINIFENTIVKGDTLVKLDKSFLDFVIIHLLPLLIGTTSDDDMYSLENRVYKSLTNLINEWESIESNNFESRLSISEEEAYHRTVIRGLIKASLEYAYNLYELQIEIDSGEDI